MVPARASRHHYPPRYVHDLIKYEFDFQFDVPATYPATAPEIELPALEGKTAKMYRGGKICLTIHFKPLWSKNRYAVVYFQSSSFHAPQSALWLCPRAVLGVGSVARSRNPIFGRVWCCQAIVLCKSYLLMVVTFCYCT